MGELIFNQHDIPREQYRYGLRASADTGCGWIAIWNALTLLGYTTDREQLIRYLTWQVPLLQGNLGTGLWAPMVCFRTWGFPVKLVSRRSRYDRCAREADVCILFYHWRRGLRMGAHFVALRHTRQGFAGFNTYRNSTGEDFYGPSLEAFLKEKGYFATALLTIRQKDRNEDLSL